MNWESSIGMYTLLLLLLSHFSRVWLCVTPEMAAHQAPPSLGFSTQEHISFSNAWKWKVKVKSLSCVQPSVTPWTAAYQAPPSIGFARQEYWSGCHCLLPEEMQWKLNKITWRWPSSGLVYHRCSIGKISSSSFSVYETSETQLS